MLYKWWCEGGVKCVSGMCASELITLTKQHQSYHDAHNERLCLCWQCCTSHAPVVLGWLAEAQGEREGDTAPATGTLMRADVLGDV